MAARSGRRHLETEPIRQGDDEIADALRTVSVPALIAAVVYITGDPGYVRGQIRPRSWIHNEFQGALAEEEKTQLREQALDAICRWRDAGCPTPAEPDRKSTRLNSSHSDRSRMPSSA